MKGPELLALIPALLVRQARAQTYSVITSSILFSPSDVQTPVAMQIDLEFAFAISAGANSQIILALPRMTSGDGDGVPGTPPSPIQMTHTTYFTPTWTEGTYTYSDPFPETVLTLVVDRAIPADQALRIIIDDDNGFMFHCGVAEDQDIKLTVRDHSLGVLVSDATVIHPAIGFACTALGDCFSRGTCDACRNRCLCSDGWGSSSDTFDQYLFPDCSERVCPKGRAWGDVPTSSNTAHAEVECSNRGLCNRRSGLCTCFAGFEGEACERRSCPNDCSGHGRCLTMAELATQPSALPLSSGTTTYGTASNQATTAWDARLSSACLCDSSWPVGLAASQRQEPEWFGPDCSLRHCPSGDDPMTEANEEDCGGVAPAGGSVTGASGAVGNLCQVDCSNRGLCDHMLGKCDCFEGFVGENCGYQLFAYNTK